MKQRLIYVDMLRVFTIFCMMLLHVAGTGWTVSNVLSLKWLSFNIYDSIVRFCIPCFVMISGAFFLDPEKDVSLKKLLNKYIPRLLTAYVFYSLIYTYVNGNYVYQDFSLITTIYEFFISFIAGRNYLWFIHMIVGLYLLTPIMRKIAEDDSILKYSIIIGFISSIVLPSLNLLPYFSDLTKVFSNINLTSSVGYCTYFLLGYFLKKIYINNKYEIVIYLLTILSLLFTIIITRELSIEANKPIATWYGYLLPNTALVAIGAFTLFKKRISKVKLNKTLTKLLNSLSKLSFSMYLIHAFILKLFFEVLNINMLSYNTVIAVPVLTLMIFFISYMLSLIISKMAVLNKYII